MAGLSDAAELLALDWLFGAGSPTRPVGQFLALTTGAISDSDTGSNLGGSTEPSGNGYARPATAFDAAAAGATANTALESFTASGGNFGTITDFAICDAVTLGGMIGFAVLDTARTVNDGDTLEFAAGAIDVTLD